MNCLFRLVRNPKFALKPGEIGQLGFEWLEVIAIEPRAIAKPDEGSGEWCESVLLNWYICRCEHGLVRMAAEDIWWALEETEELLLAPPD